LDVMNRRGYTLWIEYIRAISEGDYSHSGTGPRMTVELLWGLLCDYCPGQSGSESASHLTLHLVEFGKLG